ncbi:MAG: metallophosphoesterase [Methanomicrobiaceae archaeon]|nr:metallophosphoesterase [Methanomicrobiaceae archaeon]
MIRRLKKIDYERYTVFILVLAIIPGSFGYMSWEAENVEITVLIIEGAPESIVFIADPHLQEGNIEFIRESVGIINSLNPSVVLIGGDFVNGEETDFNLQEVWSEIDAPVYAVMGNHDYESGIHGLNGQVKMLEVARKANTTVEGYDMSMLTDEKTNIEFGNRLEQKLEECGVNVLRNECEILDLNGEELLLVCLDDGWAGLADPPEDIPETDAFTIYMIHEPECRADWPDADLILAGHTHGGQFAPPFIQALNENGVVELSGYVGESVPTYITRGLGSSHLFGIELRYQSTPEIVIINPADSTNERLKA